MSAIAAFMFLFWLVFIGVILTLGVLAVITYLVIDIYCDVVRRRKDDDLVEAVVVDHDPICDPPNACMTHGRCWTHSYWADDDCDIPNVENGYDILQGDSTTFTKESPFKVVMEGFSNAILTPERLANAQRNVGGPECDHGVSYDSEAAKGLDVAEVRKRWPRGWGPCPKGCGYNGIAYASFEHYICGDW